MLTLVLHAVVQASVQDVMVQESDTESCWYRRQVRVLLQRNRITEPIKLRRKS